MPDIKVSQLPTVGASDAADLIYAVQGGVSVQETLQQVLDLVQGSVSGIPQLIYINSDIGSDTTGNGSINNPYETYEKARSVAALSATSAIPYSIVPIGVFNITGNLALSPFVNIVGLNDGSSKIVLTGSVGLNSSFDATSNPFCYISNVALSATGGVSLTFGVSQSASIYFDIDLSGSASITLNGTGSETIVFEDGITLSGMPALYCEDCSLILTKTNLGDVTLINTITTNISLYMQGNVGNIGGVVLQNNSTGQVNAYISSCPSMSSLQIVGTLVNLSIDSSSYTVVPTFGSSATASQITLLSISEGVNADYTPINYSPNDGSLHGHLIGIDNALAGSGPGSESLQDAYDTGDDAIIDMSASRPVIFQTSTDGSETNAITTQGTGSQASPVYRVIGWRFTPAVDMQVVSLQYDDALMVSTTFGHDTAIYNYTTFEELGRVTIYKTDPLDPSTVYRTKDLNSPILLQGGTDYVFATVEPINDLVYLTKTATPNANITLVQLASLPQSSTGVSLQFPQTFTPATPNQVYLGSFVFTTLTVNESININDGTTSNNKIYEVKSTARAVIDEPVMTTAQMNGVVSPEIGMRIFNSNSSPIAPYFYNGSAWINVLNASVTSTITVTNTSASASYFVPIITASSTAAYPLYVGAGLTFNPNTNTLTTTTFSGALSGNATSATSAATVNSSNEATDTTCFPLFITASGTQTLEPKNNTGLTYNSNTNNLGCTTFTGALSGNATTSTTATNATNATNVGTTVQTTGTFYPLMVSSSSSGNQAAKMGTSFSVALDGSWLFKTSQDNGGFSFESSSGSVYRNLVRTTTNNNAQDVYSTASTNNWNVGLVFGSGSSNYGILDAVNSGATVLTITPGSTAITQFNGNFGLNGASFGSGTKVLFVANASADPSTNPSNGGILYSSSGAGKWRGSGGTVTTFGPAEPHCPQCDSDFGFEWQNEKYGGNLRVCMKCFSDEIGSKKWIRWNEGK
jgi:hypothetical protein